MTWQQIELDRPPAAPYSLGASARGALVVTAGIVAVDAAGCTQGIGDAAAQADYIIDNFEAILRAGGCSLADVFLVHIFLRSFDDYASVNAVYSRRFGPPFPARWCVAADLAKPEWLVEIAAFASRR